MAAPLDGVRVLEVANWLAAPAAAAMMADMGADVIKVEPPGGDPYRATGVKIGFDIPFAMNYSFQLDNRGKRSITVDLDKPGGAETVRELAKTADIFITNLLPERRARYGLTFEDLKAVSPKVAYVLLSGYGSEGPESWRPGFDHAAFWAASGIMGLMGEPTEAPPDCRSGQGDHTTSLNILAASLAALRMAEVTGEAQFVETCLQVSGMWTIAADYASTLASGVDPKRASRNAPRTPITNHFQCGDGRWIQFAMPKPFPAYWPRFAKAVGKPEWADLAPDLEALRKHNVAWVAELDGVFATKPLAEWGAIFDEAGIIWAGVATPLEVAASPQVQQMGWITELDHPVHGPFKTLNTPFRMHGTDTGARGPAPEAGANTEAVLREAGWREEQLAELAAAGVFG
ncbi:MAG: CaiB/BaiF CoA transferase family protein [Dehalococcoidia bacterium]